MKALLVKPGRDPEQVEVEKRTARTAADCGRLY